MAKRSKLNITIWLLCLTLCLGLFSCCEKTERHGPQSADNKAEPTTSVLEESLVSQSSKEELSQQPSQEVASQEQLSPETSLPEELSKEPSMQEKSSGLSESEDFSQGEHTAQPEDAEKTSMLFAALPLEFVFSSGAGGWQTILTLDRDGSFSGMYSDSEMGEIGEGYPNGTVYLSIFSGQFTDIMQVDDTTYSMQLSELITQNGTEEEWMEAGIRYLVTEPAGIEAGTYLLYAPETPVEKLNEEFLNWRLGSYPLMDETEETLSCYGLCDQDTGYGFFAYE